MRVLLTGAAGFIAGYLIQELLDGGNEVVGLDNFSKYGPVEKSYQTHPGYRFVEGDAKDGGLLAELLAGCDHFVAGAAKIGGISYFHEYAYDLIAENERVIAASFDAAIGARRAGTLQKITVNVSQISVQGLQAPELELVSYNGGIASLLQNQVDFLRVVSYQPLDVRMDDATFAAGTIKANGDVRIRRAE